MKQREMAKERKHSCETYLAKIQHSAMAAKSSNGVMKASIEEMAKSKAKTCLAARRRRNGDNGAAISVAAKAVNGNIENG
jgi:hypothetical protein